jgi:hypothetical protein
MHIKGGMEAFQTPAVRVVPQAFESNRFFAGGLFRLRRPTRRCGFSGPSGWLRPHVDPQPGSIDAAQAFGGLAAILIPDRVKKFCAAALTSTRIRVRAPPMTPQPDLHRPSPPDLRAWIWAPRKQKADRASLDRLLDCAH